MSMSSLRLEGAVFLAGAVLMGLEIVGSRALAPYFGTSIFVWGGLITTFLASLALGSAVGGRLADRRPEPAVLANLLLTSAVLAGLLLSHPEPLLSWLAGLPLPERFLALAASGALFGPVSVLVGAVLPFAVRLSALELATVGRTAGRLGAISTAGSILGTFGTAFFLVPAFGTTALFQGLAAALLLASLLVPVAFTPRRAVLYAACVLLLLFAPPLWGTRQTPGDTVTKIVLSKETAYHRIQVLEQDGKRAMVFDRLTQGFLPIGRSGRRPPNYTDGLAFALGASERTPRDVVIIGLGAGMLPQLLEPTGILTTTIELDAEVVEVAREHFAFRPGETARILIGDGRRVLEKEVVRTDAILLDAFFSEGVPFHLTTREFFELCRSRLSADGVFVANFVGGLTGARNGLFWAAVKTLQEVFPGVVVLQDELVDQHSVFFGNAIVIATNAPGLRKEDLRSRAFTLARTASRPEMMLWAARFFPGPYPVADVPVLTDDYSPTDALQHLTWK